uniref:BPTI/Kunitz inhibitor domain-containing protein n=1 Tax=Amphimedon queenslandica TaxID=400682 RepID=A0A1X7VVK4_AMPQE
MGALPCLLLLCALIHLVSSVSRSVRCRGTYYRPNESCMYKGPGYSKFYYDSYEDSCRVFVYRECIYEPNSGYYGNPHNMFDKLRDCQNTCFSPIYPPSSSSTSSLHTSSSTLMINPTQSLTVSAFGTSPSTDDELSFFGASTDDEFSFFGASTDDDFYYAGTSADTLFFLPTLTPSSSSFPSSSTPFLSSLTSSSISPSFSVPSPSLFPSLTLSSSSLALSLSLTLSSSSLSPSLSSLHTFPSSSSVSTSQPDLTISSTSSTSELLNQYFFIPGSILLAIIIMILPMLYIIIFCYMRFSALRT